jgi:hypothetical protein
MISVDSFIRFLESRGPRVLLSILEDLNSGLPHKQIASKWNMTEATLSRHIHRYYLQRWAISPDTQMLLEQYNQVISSRVKYNAPNVIPLGKALE